MYGTPPAFDMPLKVPLGFCYGVSSAARAGLDIELVGEAPPLIGEEAKNPSYRKMAAFLARLEDGPETADSLVLCVCGADIWFTPRATPAALFAAYDALGSEQAVLVHTERDCFPPIRHSCEYYPPANSSFRFANGGGYLGTKAATIHFLRAVMRCISALLKSNTSPDTPVTDQDCLHELVSSGSARQHTRDVEPFLIQLDSGCIVFQSLWKTRFDNTRGASSRCLGRCLIGILRALAGALRAVK